MGAKIRDKRFKVQDIRANTKYFGPLVSCRLCLVWIFLVEGISLQRIAMINKEILTAYGAYALRKNYHHRSFIPQIPLNFPVEKRHLQNFWPNIPPLLVKLMLARGNGVGALYS